MVNVYFLLSVIAMLRAQEGRVRNHIPVFLIVHNAALSPMSASFLPFLFFAP